MSIFFFGCPSSYCYAYHKTVSLHYLVSLLTHCCYVTKWSVDVNICTSSQSNDFFLFSPFYSFNSTFSFFNLSLLSFINLHIFPNMFGKSNNVLNILVFPMTLGMKMLNILVFPMVLGMIMKIKNMI